MLGRSRMLLVVAAFCAALQIASATWLVKSFDAPNVSTDLAKNLLATGRYEVWSPRLKGPDHNQTLLRRFHLPGEALYLAFFLRLLPAGLHRYIHVPVTTTLVVSVAWVASWIGGTSLGLLAGLVASLQPFVVFHGPIWEDTFLAAALIWLVLALLSLGLEAGRPASAAQLFALAAIAGWAAVTRMEAQTVLLLLAAAALVVPAMRGLRRQGIAIAAGILMALCVWGFRNWRTVGEFAIGTTHDGVTLWWSNSPYTRQALRFGQVEDVYRDRAVMDPLWARTANMTEGETNRYYTRLAVQYILGQPLDFIHTSLNKLCLSLLGIAPERPLTSPRNIIAVLNAVLLLSLGGLGILGLRSKLHPGVYPAALAFLAVIGLPGLFMLLIGPIGLRYYITAQGILWIGCAAAIRQRTRGATGKPA